MVLESNANGSYLIAPGSRRDETTHPFSITSSTVIFKYNPHQMTPADVLDTLVGRDELLSEMIAHLRAQKGSSRPKHIFLYGPRGIGKTTMLLALRYRVADNPGLRAAFDIIQFSEEERRVANLPSFAIRALELLVEVRPESKESKADLENARSAPEQAFDILLEAGNRSTDRQVLLLLDNFDELVIAAISGRSRRFKTKQIKPLSKLERLLTSPNFLVAATALQPPRKRKDFPKELLEHFDPIIQLSPLADAMTLLRKRAEKDRRKGFLKSLPRFAPRIDGLNRLADGNPRLLVFLYDCLGDQPLPDLVEIVQHIVDDLTPMYQDVIDRLLNRGQAAVLEMLASRGGVGKAKDIAELTYQDEQTVRTFLGNLCDLGLAVRSSASDFPGRDEEGAVRETVFRIHPPLFQIWYEMRHFERQKGLFLVRFFALLTEPEEVHRILGELQEVKLSPTKAGLTRLMENVAAILDPAWEAIKAKYVDEILSKGGKLRDALDELNEAIAIGAADQDHRRIGFYVVRSNVKYGFGDREGAEADLKEADELQRETTDIETQSKLKTAWSEFLAATGESRRAVETAQHALDLCDNLKGPTAQEIRAAALMALSSAYIRRSNYRGALQAAEQANKLLNKQRSPLLKGRAAHHLGIICNYLADNIKAIKYLETALEIQQEFGDSRGQADSLGDLGNVYFDLSDYAQAREYYERALAIEQEIGNRLQESNCLGSLGNIYSSLGHYERAREYHENSLAIKQEIGDRRGEAVSLGNLGNVYYSLGDYERARDYHEKSLAIVQEIGDRSSEAASLGNLGKVYYSLGDYERSRDLFEKSLAIQQEIGERKNESVSLGNLGDVYRSLGDYERSHDYLEKSLVIAQEIGYREGEAVLLGSLGSLYYSLGDYERARDYNEKSLSIKQEIGDRSGEAKSLGKLGILALSRGKSKDALRDLRKAHELFVSLGERPNIRQSAADIIGLLFQLVATAIRDVDSDRAESLLNQAMQLLDDAGAENTLSLFTKHLLVPTLQHSRDLAPQLLALLEGMHKYKAFEDIESAFKTIEALLRFYAKNRSRTELNGLGPAEVFLSRSLIDRIERPQHVLARELLKAEKPAEARKTLESILEQTPDDVEALIALAATLAAEGKLDEAEQRLNDILVKQKDFPPALLALARIEQERGQDEKAVEILQDLLKREPRQREIYPMLARIFRRRHQFENLAGTLRKWRDATEDAGERQRIDVWIVEAYIMTGDLSRATTAMPGENFAPEDTSNRLLLDFLRVFFALYKKNAATARRYAVSILEFTADLPPGKVPDFISPQLSARAREHLGDRESKFLLDLSLAVTQRVDPMQFANEFLSETEVKELSRRIVEEQQLAVKALRSGKIQGYGDLFRISNRSIGPAAGLAALGEAYEKLTSGHKMILLGVFTEAVRHGTHAEVSAALGAIGKIFPELEPLRRSQCLAAILDLTVQSKAEKISRERAVNVMNILYPNLTKTERQDVRQGLENIREEMESPALVEFFNETIPQVEGEVKP